jgi:predicted Zn-dependent peptidase
MPAEIRRRKLKNGLTVLTEKMPDVRSVCIGIWLKKGSRDEAKRLNGISHFIEHLVFKGTESRSARDLALAMDSIGAQMDAFTSKEYTCFYARVLDQHLATTIDLLSDIVQRPLFDPTELERERQVVLEEIQMVDDSPEEVLYDLFSESFYPRHSLGRPIQGTAQTVGGFSRRQLLSFFRSSYRPENMLVVAAGNLDHKDVGAQVARAFAGLEAGNATHGRTPRPRTRGGVVTCAKKGLAQLHLLLGLPVFPSDERGRFALHVFSALLGGTMSSRLFQKIREERGLVYSVYSAVNGFLDTGFLAVYAGTSPSKGKEVVRLIMQELADLRDNGPTAQELDVAKEHLKGSLMLALESTSSRMSNLARQEIYQKRQRSLAATLAGVDAVTAERVHGMARELTDSADVALAAVGRVSQLKLPEGALRL